MINKIFSRIFNKEKKEAVPRDFEWEDYQKPVREQFENLFIN